MLLCIFVCVGGGGGKMTLEDGSCDVQEQAQKLHEAISGEQARCGAVSTFPAPTPCIAGKYCSNLDLWAGVMRGLPENILIHRCDIIWA